MRNILIRFTISAFFLFSFFPLWAQQQGVGIGTSNPNPNAILDIVTPARNKGVLVPRLTTSERNSMSGALSSTDNGLLVYDSTLNGFYFWNGSSWNSVTVTQDLELVGNTLRITNNASATDIDLSSLIGTNTDEQTLSLAGTDLSITGGNTVDLSPLQDGVDDADNDPLNEVQDLQLVGNTLSITNNASATNIDLAPFAGTNTDNQDLDFTSGVISLSGDPDMTMIDLSNYDSNVSDDFNGAFSNLTGVPSGLSDGDDDTHLTEAEVDTYVSNNGYLTSEVDGSITNEIQDLQLAGNNLTITNNGSATTIDLSPYLDDTDTHLTEDEVDIYVNNNGYLTSEVDGSTTNEIQDLQLAGNNLTITNNGSATTIDLSPYLDDTDTHLTEAEVDTYVSNNGYLTSEVDGSITNEIQDLQLAGNNLTITNNGSATTIDLSPYLDDTDTHLTEAEVDTYVSNNGYLTSEVDGSTTNEIQSLSIVGSSLSISGGNTVSIPTYSPTKDAFKAYFGANIGYSAGQSQLRPDKKTYDLGGSYDETNYQYKITARGVFVISGVLTLYQDGSGAEEIDIIIFVDGSEKFRKECAFVSPVGGSSNPVAIEFSFENYFSGGEVIEFGIDPKSSSKTLIGGDDSRSYITGHLVVEDY